MRKIKCCAAILLFTFLLAGCTNQQSSETDMAPNEIATAITDGQSNLPELQQITWSDEEFHTYLSDYYMIDGEQVEDGAICYADGVEASEIAVLALKDGKDSETVKKELEKYIQNRTKVFEGYAPQQAEMVKNGTVVVHGKYVALLICQDTSKAEKSFLNCFGKDKKSSSVTKAVSTLSGKKEDAANSNVTEDAYDSDAVLQAWKSGDDSSLSERNLEILNSAKDVIKKEIKDNMSDYEKELAIHDYITDWSSFDYSVFGRSSEEGFEDGSDTPYGVLINKEGMCHGYSSTFQMFMDMLDIECITVFGTPNSNGVEHSWNMVKLDGEWYCVDVAWDDPVGGTPEHTYFNVTSEELRESGIHEWDEGDVPEATATTYRFKN